MARVDDFLNTINLAQKELSKRQLEEICRNAEVEQTEINGNKLILLPFFREKITITYPEGTISGNKSELSLQDQGLILHYLLYAKPLPLKDKLITFREIPSGEFYFRPFLQRAQIPFVRFFGGKKDLFLKAGDSLGALPLAYGDAAFTVKPFPKTPVTLVLWEGDEEFPPEGTILFDESIREYLPLEDVAYLASITVYKLIRLAKTFSLI